MLKGYPKLHLIKSKIISLYSHLIANFFVVAIGFLIFTISIIYYYVFILYFIYLFYIYKVKKDLVILKCILVISVVFLLLYFLNCYYLRVNSSNSVSGVITSIEKGSSYLKITIKHGFKKTIVYDYDFHDLKIGNYAHVIGESIELTCEKIPNGFNYFKYYQSERVVNIINLETIQVKRHFNIYLIKRGIYSYVDYFFDDTTRAYIKTFVLGDNSEVNKDEIYNFSVNNINHLFAISGMHISLMIYYLTFLLEKIKLPKKNIEKVNIYFLLLFSFISGFSVSVLRSCLLYIISRFKKLKLSNLDIISILFIFFLLINPSYIYSISFKLSFLASTFIILITMPLNKMYTKNELYKVYQIGLLSLLVQFVLFPFCININNTYNILNVISNVFFIYLISFIIIPFTFIVFILPFLNKYYYYIIIAFTYINKLFSSYLNITINLASFSSFKIVLYYLLIVLFCLFYKTKYKYIITFIFSLLLIAHYQKINLNSSTFITFLDLNQGDCIVIDFEYNKGVVIIDTGTGYKSALTNYLKSQGVRKIDLLFLTHNDTDHNGEANELFKNFEVSKVIISAYDNSVYYHNNIIKTNSNTVFELNGYEFLILSPNLNYFDDNDNSLVIYSKIEGMNYLFLGDVSKKVEEELIELNLDVDVIKVAHHGSRTSSSALFYQSINPLAVIIQTGHIKRYGFPHQEAIDVLNKYHVFRTDLDYSVVIKVRKKKSIIKGLNENNILVHKNE